MSAAMSATRTPMHHADQLSSDPAVRAVAATGLIVVGIIHALEIQGQLGGAVWLAAGFALLAIVAPLAGVWLLARPAGLAWAFGGLVCLTAALGYIITRSIAVPGDPRDVGNWLEPLGVAALITEWIVVILAGMTLASIRRAVRQMARPIPAIPAPAIPARDTTRPGRRASR
jgi:hypothetical protein